MSKITGVKSVDFKVTAIGHGVVNWQGSISGVYSNQAEDFVNNHLFPKTRGLDIMRLTKLNSPDLANAKLIVSQNCIKHHLFKPENFGLNEVTPQNVLQVLPSFLGIVRGYVIADKLTKLSVKRKSPLLMTDFIDTAAVLEYEQFANAGVRNDKSIYSKTNVGDTSYIGHGSINIEDLQFIALEDTHNRSAYRDIVSIAEGEKVAQLITDYLKTLDFEGALNPKAEFKTNYVRIGGLVKQGEAGVLINEDGLNLLVQECLSRIQNLYIRQSDGHLKVTEVLVDYNEDSAMRIKKDIQLISSKKQNTYAVYYENVEVSKEEYEAKIKKQADDLKKGKDKKEKEAKKKEEKEAAKVEQSQPAEGE